MGNGEQWDSVDILVPPTRAWRCRGVWREKASPCKGVLGFCLEAPVHFFAPCERLPQEEPWRGRGLSSWHWCQRRWRPDVTTSRKKFGTCDECVRNCKMKRKSIAILLSWASVRHATIVSQSSHRNHRSHKSHQPLLPSSPAVLLPQAEPPGITHRPPTAT